MRCRACEAPLDPGGVFPGGAVRCSCGVDNPVPLAHATPAAHDPYREPAPHPPPSTDGLPGPHARALGPLCPRCTRLLREDEARSALGCVACRGFFVDHSVLAALVAEARPEEHSGPGPRPPHQVPRESEVHYAWCPDCGQPMGRMTFGKRSGVVVDVCPKHGTWFDGGELDAVLEFVRGGGLESDIAVRPPSPAVDPAAREMEARLEVHLLHEQQHQAEQVNDLVRLLRTTQRRW